MVLRDYTFVPCAWKEGIIISLYKGKGPRNECASYRPITLLSVPGKVFTHVLLSRIDPLLRSKRRFEQSGFTSGRSTLDAILALRLLSEVHHEFSQASACCLRWPKGNLWFRGPTGPLESSAVAPCILITKSAVGPLIDDNDKDVLINDDRQVK